MCSSAITNMNNSGRSLSMTRVKLGHFLLEQDQLLVQEDNNNNNRYSNASSELSTTTTTTSSNSSVSPRLSSFCNIDERYSTSSAAGTDDNTTSSPFSYYYNNNNNNNDNLSSPWNQAASTSPYLKSPWIKLSSFPPHPTLNNLNYNTTPNTYTTPNNNNVFLVGSLLREEGHVYSLAANRRMLYTGSQSKNIRVWNNFSDAGGFKSSSGLVKAIVISKHNNTVFTGHQDGKIRLWSSIGKRIGTFPTMADYFRSSINPKNYVQVTRHHKVPRVKHFDAVSCMSLNQEGGLLYSGSWDKTIKVWRLRDGKCLESIDAHEDAINSIVVGFGGLLFSGSADGTVKVWRRQLDGKKGRHVHVTTLLTQETAVTALAVSGNALYAGSSDGLVNFWERDKEELCYGGVLRGHKSAVLCVATAGSLVMSGSADKTICVWKRQQQQYAEAAEGVHSCLAVLSGHNGPVKCLAVEYDEEEEEHWIVYSGSSDKSVKIWRVSEGNIPDNELPNLL